jgi:hypothetical protein
MQLELAIVQSCSDTGCRVQPLDSGEILTADYSSAILQYQIRIIPHQLVIVNRGITPPQIVWRWTRATVAGVSDERVELRHDDGRQLWAKRASDLDTPLQVGDRVFLTGFQEGDWTVVDVAIEGKPAHPDRLSAALFPTIHI